MGKVLWLVESVYGSDLSESVWNSLYRNDEIWTRMNELKWIEVKWVIWRKWARTTLWEWSYGRLRVSLSKWLEWSQWESPYGRERVSLSKWLEMSDLIKPYQNEWNRWDLNEMKWIERLEVKWVIWRKWARTTLWKSPYGQLKVNPMEVTWMNPMRMSLSKWMDSMRFEWIEVNRVNRSEMIDLKDLTWNNPMRISLWVGWECPYQSDLNEPYEKVPIKMIRFDEIWMNWGE